MSNNHKKAVFFDRDGVLNIDTGYPHRVEDCHMIDGADDALKFVNDHGYSAFIVTNQGGIGLGMYDEDALNSFNKTLLRFIEKKGGVISDIAHSPHHPNSEDEHLRGSEMRKPNPGMLLMLAEKYNIDLAHSFMIGDRETDMQAAAAAGCDGYLFEGGNLYDFIRDVMEKRQ